MFEDLFKKSPGKNIEGLEDQIENEKMKLMSNEEKIKADLENIGGIEGLDREINRKSPKGRMIAGGALTAAGVMMLYMLSIDGTLHVETSDETMEAMRNIVLYGNGAGGVALTASGAIMGVAGGVKEWWEKRKLENLKAAAVEAGIV